MKTNTVRTLRFANLFALAAAFVALCPHTTLAETEGTGGPNLPPPVCVVEPNGVTIDANVATPQSNGSTTYTTVAVKYVGKIRKISSWVNVTTSGVMTFADGTVTTVAAF